MLQTILDLRIHCNLGTTMQRKNELERHLDPDEALTLLEEENGALCAGCSMEVPLISSCDDLSSGALSECTHILCANCFAALRGAGGGTGQYECPLCRAKTSLQALSFDTPPTTGNSENGPRESAKLKRLVEDLLESRDKEKR